MIIALSAITILFLYSEILDHGSKVSSNDKYEIPTKFLNSINQIIDDKVRKSDKVIFLFTDFDCSSCVEKGIEICNEISSKYAADIPVIAISRTTNNLEVDFNEKVIFYQDYRDMLRKELKYSPTPKMLLLDKQNAINFGFTITTDKGEVDRNIEKLDKLVEDLKSTDRIK